MAPAVHRQPVRRRVRVVREQRRHVAHDARRRPLRPGRRRRAPGRRARRGAAARRHDRAAHHLHGAVHEHVARRPRGDAVDTRPSPATSRPPRPHAASRSSGDAMPRSAATSLDAACRPSSRCRRCRRRAARRRRSRPTRPRRVSSSAAVAVLRPIREMPIAGDDGVAVSGSSIIRRRYVSPVRRDPRCATASVYAAARGVDTADPPAAHAAEPSLLDRRRQRRAADPALRRLPALGASAGRVVPRVRRRARTGSRRAATARCSRSRSTVTSTTPTCRRRT